MNKLAAVCLLGLSVQVHAYDGLSSEMSHAVGGALMAGVVTRAYSDHENRAWIGFGLSTAAFAIEQSYEIAHGADRRSQVLDVVWHAAGSALGAWYSDKYLLMPVIHRNALRLVLLRQF